MKINRQLSKVHLVFGILLAPYLAPVAHAQNIKNLKSFEAAYGRSGMSGEFIRGSHERFLSNYFNIGAAIFYNSSAQQGLHYHAIGLQSLVYYYSPLGDRTNNVFQVKVGLGLKIQQEKEDRILRKMTFRQKLNPGMVGELAGEWAFSKDFSLTLAGAQSFFFSRTLETKDFDVSVGIKLKTF